MSNNHSRIYLSLLCRRRRGQKTPVYSHPSPIDNMYENIMANYLFCGYNVNDIVYMKSWNT